MAINHHSIEGSPYLVAPQISAHLDDLAKRVADLRSEGSLSVELLGRIEKYFRMKTIYHSNAIEGNQLSLGETHLVVTQGLTISGKPLRDQAEAVNLSQALDFLEELVKNSHLPLNETVIRQLHKLILQGINDRQAGSYRNIDVAISGSAAIPSRPESIPPDMEMLCNWIAENFPTGGPPPINPILVACVLHCWFVMIHPFIDGNGRTARILLNLVLLRLGYPPIIISVDERQRYYNALAESDDSDITEFVQLVIEAIDDSLEQWELARAEERGISSKVAGIAAKAAAPILAEIEKDYQVWRQSMALFKSYVDQSVEQFNVDIQVQGTGIHFYFSDFGELDSDKYRVLKHRDSASRTWFFRLDYRLGDDRARYLFFFGYPSGTMRGRKIDVVLYVSREWPAGSFYYARINEMPPHLQIPVFEIGYDPKSEEMLVVGSDGKAERRSMGELATDILGNIVDKGVASSAH